MVDYDTQTSFLVGFCSDMRKHSTDYHNFDELHHRIEAAEHKGLRLVRVALGFGADDWTSLQNKKSSIKSLYLFYCNLTLEALQKTENYKAWGFVQKGVAFGSCMGVLLPVFQQLSRGYEVELGPNGACFLYGGVFYAPTDTPQAQEICGFAVGSTAHHPSRTSHVHQSQLGDLSYDLKAHRKTLDHVRAARTKQAALPTSAAAKSLLKDMGMSAVPSIFESLPVDVTMLSPPLNCHCFVLGQFGKAMLLTMQECTPTGLKVFINAFHKQPLPPGYPPYTSPRQSQ
jgi:hypothetical protein